MSLDEVEVAIVGGGPAGLSAALFLGRCRRRVVVFDDGTYRNASSRVLHGFLGRDGVPTEDFRRAARSEISRYETVELRAASVTDIIRHGASSFVVHSRERAPLLCRKVLLATGLIDELPPITGLERLFGDGVYSCPYCDGWELRDQPLAAYDRTGRYSITLLQWSQNLVVCSDGPSEIDAAARQHLESMRVAIDERRVTRFERRAAGVLLSFDRGEPLLRRAVFINNSCRPHSDLPRKLGCKLDERGGVCVNRHESTSVAGVYVAGDASRDALQAIVAAGEGASAAMAINSALSSAASR